MRFDAPLRLTSARAWRTYLGGRFLDELHGVASPADTHFPEEWICSAVRAVNPGREDVVEGLCRLAGTDLTLKDALEAHPAEMLGAAHVARWGRTPAVLVKLIDAAERLGVQVHPDRAAAMRFFASPFGKTECWHVVGGREIGGPSETPCFALERLDVADEMPFPSAPGAFCGLFVLSGRGTLESAAGAEPLRPCDQFFVPAASAGFRIRAESPLAIFLARPPQSPAPAVV